VVYSRIERLKVVVSESCGREGTLASSIRILTFVSFLFAAFDYSPPSYGVSLVLDRSMVESSSRASRASGSSSIQVPSNRPRRQVYTETLEISVWRR